MSVCSALECALASLLPNSIAIRTRTFAWCSAGFSGQRYVVELRTTSTVPDIDHFALHLGEQALPLDGQFVADIAVTARRIDHNGGTVLTIEALVLDDDV